MVAPRRLNRGSSVSNTSPVLFHFYTVANSAKTRTCELFFNEIGLPNGMLKTMRDGNGGTYQGVEESAPMTMLCLEAR